ncbi:hypothetical protein LTR39_000715 [Cryomyces antarcticus]|nr:hypothetical protein LTR39_000715 [Cryomyces antarcticus]
MFKPFVEMPTVNSASTGESLASPRPASSGGGRKSSIPYSDTSLTTRSVEDLLEGFGSLRVEYKLLADKNRKLEQKLAWAKQQYEKFADRFLPPDTARKSVDRAFAPDPSDYEAPVPKGPSDWLETLDQSLDGDRRARARNIREGETAHVHIQDRLSKKRDSGVRIWSGASADRAEGSTTMPSISESPLEQDFTVPGTPSKLGCPFPSMSRREVKQGSHAASIVSKYRPPSPPQSSASRIAAAQGRRSKRSSFCDPIKAEVCGMESLSPAPSTTGNAGVCPIRFLDDHSPEEVAKYFENHKHEIPRSHEACVKRFQSNTAQIQELDAKYGSLVEMIQGLGVKHQPMLPDEPEDEGVVEERESVEKVKKWARAISGSLHPEDVDAALPDDEQRLPHFDRPLKDIRVGESPSRPWGITVPARYDQPAGPTSCVVGDPRDETLDADTEGPREDLPAGHRSDDLSIKPAPTAVSRVATADVEKGATRCPFGFDRALPPPAEEKETPRKLGKVAAEEVGQAEPALMNATKATQDIPVLIQPPVNAENEAENEGGKHAGEGEFTPQPRMLFTGPVFIGYDVEQALSLLKQSGRGTGN